MTAYETAHIDEIASTAVAALDPDPPPLRDRELRDERVPPQRRRERRPGARRVGQRRAGALLRRDRPLHVLVDGDEIDAPAGTCVWVNEPAAKRAATAKADGTLVLAVGAAAPGEAYAPAGWDTQYLEGDK